MTFKDKNREKEYKKQWVLEHSDHCKTYQKEYHRNKFDTDPSYVTRRRSNTKNWDLQNLDKIKERYTKNKNKILKQQKIYARDNKEKITEWRRRHYLKYRRMAVNHYTNGNNKCMCCGESKFEFLTFDHINGAGRKHRDENKISNMAQWLVKNNFPEGFQVLCYNCNCAKGHCGYCPHKKKGMYSW